MSHIPQKKMPSRLKRYEVKVAIPEDMIIPLSERISIYCSQDKHSRESADGFYQVNTLYLDSPDYLFLKRRLDRSENRFNMRIRSYGDGTKMPYFFEIKQKRVNTVLKFRATVFDKNWSKIFTTPGYGIGEEEDSDTSNLSLFFITAYKYNAAPKVLTQYSRKAFVSNIDDYCRITIDTDLRYQPEDGYNLVPDNEKMIPYDNSTLFDPGCSVILELKCEAEKVPVWLVDLIRYFNLNRRRFSKYVTGVTEVLNLYQYDTCARQATVRSLRN